MTRRILAVLLILLAAPAWAQFGGGGGGSADTNTYAVCQQTDGGATLAASTTYYLSNSGAPATTVTLGRFVPYTSSTLVGFSFSMSNTGTLASAGNVTYSVMKNQLTDSDTATGELTASTALVTKTLTTPLTITTSDYIQLKMVTPAWGTAPTGVRVYACAFLTIP